MARSVNKEVAAYLQWRVREWKRSGRTQRDLAKAAGISSPQISDLLNEGVGAGFKTIEGLAKVFGMTVPELMTVAEEWAKTQPKAQPEPTQAASRRGHAAELAREDGVSEEAIKSVLDEPLRDEDAQRSTVFWILRMKRRDLALGEGPPRRG